MKSNACYEGLFRVKLVGFGSSSNFCNKKIMKKKKKKKMAALKKGRGLERETNFFQQNQENILF